MATRQVVNVVQYKDHKAYQKDAQRRLDAGWSIQGQTETAGHVNLGRTAAKATALVWALGPLGLIAAGSRTSGKISVTWVRDEEIVIRPTRPKRGTRKPRPVMVDAEGPSRPREAVIWMAISLGILALAIITWQGGWLVVAGLSTAFTLPRAIKALMGVQRVPEEV